MAKTYNLEDLRLEYGAHTVQAQVKGKGYNDSEKTTAVIYTSAPRIIANGTTVIVYNVSKTATAIGLYVDGSLHKSVSVDGASGTVVISVADEGIDESVTHSAYVSVTYSDGTVNSNIVSDWTARTMIYGVKWTNDTSTTMERTDDAIGMTYAINSSSGEIASDFNDVFPWTEAKVETDECGNVMLHMPEMWFRVDTDEDGNICAVAVSNQEGATGNWYHTDEFYYGCYGGYVSDSKLYSKSGQTQRSSETRAKFRTYAKNMGDGYCQLDLYHLTVMTFLWWIEWATKDSASIMKGRYKYSGKMHTAGGAKIVATGGTDSLTTPSGFETAYEQMRYHYIEDFIGNTYKYVDGATWNTNLYVTADPSLYSDSTENFELWGKDGDRNKVTGSTLAFGWISSQPFLIWSTKNNADDTISYVTGFCNCCENTDSTSSCVYSGSCCNKSLTYSKYGLSSFYRIGESAANAYAEGRLLKIP